MDYSNINNMTPDELKQWRKTNGYSQGLLAIALGVIPFTVSRWERGVRVIPSFLHLALRCLELEGGELQKNKGAKDTKKPFQYPIQEERFYISEKQPDRGMGKATKKKKRKENHL